MYLAAVQPEFVDYIQRRIFDAVKIAVVAVARYDVAVFAIPFRMFHADVFGRDHFAVEHHLLASVFLVIPFDQPEYLLYESRIARVVVDLDAERFGGLYQSVHADGQVLAVHVDVACVEQRRIPLL